MSNKKTIARTLAAFLACLAVLTFAAETNPPSVTAVAATRPSDAIASASNDTTFVLPAGHARFLLPDYWTNVPDAALNAYKDSQRKIRPGRPVPNYVMAIQRKSLFTFAMPYALVEIDNRPMPTQADIFIEQDAFTKNIARAYLQLHRQGLFGELTPEPATYDPLHHVIVGCYRMYRAEDKRRITSVTASYPCKYGYLRFSFFMPQDEEDTYLPVVQRIIDSVQFDQGFEYVPSREDSPNIANAILRAMAIAAAGLALAWVVLMRLARPAVAGEAGTKKSWLRHVRR